MSKKRDTVHIQSDDAIVLPAPACPNCGAVLDRSTGIAVNRRVPAGPKPGSVSICCSCGELNIFQDDFSIRLATDEEVRSILTSRDGALIRHTIALFRRADNPARRFCKINRPGRDLPSEESCESHG